MFIKYYRRIDDVDINDSLKHPICEMIYNGWSYTIKFIF